MHDRLGGRTMLRDPAGVRIPVNNRLEKIANDRIPDDQLLCRDPERERERESQFMIMLISLNGVQQA